MSERRVKQLIVPAKYFLECIAADISAPYPVTLSILSENGGALLSANSKEEIYSLCKSREVYQSSVIGAICKRGSNIELRLNGRYADIQDFMPERRHMDTLTRIQVKQLYQSLFPRKMPRVKDS